MYEIGLTKDNADAKGLAFIINLKINYRVIDFNSCSSRLFKMKVNLQGKHSVTVMNANPCIKYNYMTAKQRMVTLPCQNIQLSTEERKTK